VCDPVTPEELENCARREPHSCEDGHWPENNNGVLAYCFFERRAFTLLPGFDRLLNVTHMQDRGPASNLVNLDNVSIKIVIAYDSAATGKRAEAIYERLARRLGNRFDFKQRLWRFDVLEQESLRAEAARDTADADIVIVATNQGKKLPDGVQNWLESSLQRHSGAAALVALLDHPSAPVQPYLEEVARRGGMDFFAQTGEDASEMQLPLFDAAESEKPRWLEN
jgi:hypothetical protein